MNRCPYCRSRALARARNGNVKATCGDKQCLTARERERKRMVRAKARGEAPTPPAEPIPAPSGVGSFLAPWGRLYGSEMEAWADCLLVGGLEGLGDVSQEEQSRRAAMLREMESGNG